MEVHTSNSSNDYSGNGSGKMVKEKEGKNKIVL